MMLPSWNNFLQPLLHFVVVRSNHDERLVRIILPIELMLISLEEEERRKKEEEDFARSSLQGCWSSLFGCLFSACLLSVCLCGLLYESLYRFEIEIWSCMTREYNENEKQYLIVLKCNFICFESVVCDMMMYSALI
ncbi:hypothetical protein SETIT_9G480000v2 [Setaria italica]|uniref:Uncharacterized protein n=1 Tax=Setaria italica TaxID=4555 RepID=A0A368STQ5_SETIT|nr:hypothetical protein SETIT_9G480000v2 [Setaria italica]